MRRVRAAASGARRSATRPRPAPKSSRNWAKSTCAPARRSSIRRPTACSRSRRMKQVIPLPELYRMCEIAREILRGPYEVGRVIARPFEGEPGHFVRTANRHDYAVPPPPGMLLDKLADAKVEVLQRGQNFRRISRARHRRACQDEEQRRRHGENPRGDGAASTAVSSSSIWSISISSTGIATMWKATAGRSRSSTAGCPSSAPRCARTISRF